MFVYVRHYLLLCFESITQWKFIRINRVFNILEIFLRNYHGKKIGLSTDGWKVLYIIKNPNRSNWKKIFTFSTVGAMVSRPWDVIRTHIHTRRQNERIEGRHSVTCTNEYFYVIYRTDTRVTYCCKNGQGVYYRPKSKPCKPLGGYLHPSDTFTDNLTQLVKLQSK